MIFFGHLDYWRNGMQYQLAAFADEAAPNLEGQIEAMRENGISLLEIRGVDGQNISDITIQKAKDIRSRLHACGITVWSIGSPYGKIGITDDFQAHLDKFKRGLEIADILGATHIRLFSFYISDNKMEEHADTVMERLAQFVRAAKGGKIALCHENEKGIYGDNATRCAEIHRNLPELGAVFDPANFVQCGQDTIEAWQKIGSHVEYMHIKDALENGNVVPAGKGIGNLKYLLSNYKGKVLTLEPHLSVFEGFETLEASRETKANEYRYPSSRAAFDAGVTALKELIG
jgi:sugar phosphate isomerase/epimerase